MAVNSRATLKEYALRALGAPVLEINVDDDQLEDRLDEALAYYRDNHYDGIEKVYLKHQVTSDDITNGYIPAPDYIIGVNYIYTFTEGSSSRNLFDLQYQLRLNDLYDLTSTSIIYYSTVMNYLQLLDTILNGQKILRYNRHTDRIYIDMNWSQDVDVGDYLLLDCYRALDPQTFTKAYNDPWLKHYVTALFKRQWAINLKKFNGLQLPGGVTVDGDSMYNEAMNEIKELEDEAMSKAAPLEFYLG